MRGDRRVILVTGGSRGIGAAVVRAAVDTYDVVAVSTGAGDAAQRLAGELAGDCVEGHGCVRLECADVSVEEQVVALFRRVDAAFGRVDVLVNNAGIAGGHGPLASVGADMLARLFAVNVTGAFLCAREAAQRMSTAHGGRGGSIVNVSSRAAVIGGAGEWVHYAASKGAIDTMTVGLARELADVGIRVNAVRPGLIDTEFHEHAPPGRLESMAPTVPMRRAGSAAEVAAAVLWLASPAASYVTGAIVDVSGGR